MRRGRTYFPGADFSTFDNAAKKQIEADIERDLAEALKGIKQLPKGARLGVFIAYCYYYRLLKKISKTPAAVILEKRKGSQEHKKRYCILGLP